MKRKICEFILIVLFYALHCTAGRVLTVGGISPNLLIILPVLFGFLKGQYEGIYVGFLAGLMYDIYNYDIIGFSSIVMMTCGYFSGYFYQKYEENEVTIPLMLVLISNLVYGFLSYICIFLLKNKLDVLFYLKRFVIPESIYTVIFTVIIFKFIVFLNKHFEGKPRKRVTEYDQGNI